MLFNTKLNKVHCFTDCLKCEKFDEQTLKCRGLGQICYEYDPLTQTVFDGVTRLPISKIKKEN